MSENPQGTVYIEATVTYRRALSKIVSHWSPEECEALRNGDPAAYEELRSAMLAEALMRADTAEVNVMDLRIEGDTRVNP